MTQEEVLQEEVDIMTLYLPIMEKLDLVRVCLRNSDFTAQSVEQVKEEIAARQAQLAQLVLNG